MSRRRRHSFGYSPETHRRRARMNASEFRHDVKMLKVNLANGECGRAFIRLKSLVRLQGEFNVDRGSVTGASFPRAGGMTKQIEPLSKRFAAMCIRSPSR